MRLTAHAQTAGTHCGHTLNGCSGLRSYGTYQTHDTAYCLRYLRDDRDALRAQLAEAQAQVQTARDALADMLALFSSDGVLLKDTHLNMTLNGACLALRTPSPD